ncbi:hypothetical protein ONZ45_g17337 [Pleurotus djamor]|nr:hypothetical protein ONZ45_g17337 [Pleurotus djamor]
MATTLPSFIELMASLGLDQATAPRDTRCSSPYSSPRASPRSSLSRDSSPSIPRSGSSTSLKDVLSARSRAARYTPYSPKLSAPRRGSLSSVSSSASDNSSCPSSPRFTSRSRSRKRTHQLTINICESSNDLSANTPISSYVRRKTPGTSPTSTVFPREDRDDAAACLTPLSLPTLPPLPPLSGSSDEFPLTPTSQDSDFDVQISAKPSERRRRPMGTRISISPFSSTVKSTHRVRRRHVDNAE